jgi:quercetin dioxygenase-like cupin family protein
MLIRKLADVPSAPTHMDGARDVTKQLVVGSADGAPNFAFRVFTIAPGGHSPHHTHDVEHVNYIISGQGALVDAEGRLNPLGVGDFAFVAPHDVHQFRNTGPEPFVFICAVPKAYE